MSNNTTEDNATNAGVKEEAPKAVEKTAKVENTKESVSAAVAAKVGAETPETKAADKTALKANIDSLEQKLKAAKNADEAVLKTAREELAKAKEVFEKADATQDEVNAKVTTLNVLTKAVAESEATAVAAKEEAKKDEAKAKSEEKQTAEVKEAKKELTQVTSEAEVTNVLAKEAIRKNEVKLEAKPAVEKAVAKNEEVIKVANELLGNDETTKEQIARSLEELGNSIKAVYSELENAGVRRDGKYGVALSANEGYTAASKELRKENGEFLGSTGKSYQILDGNQNYKIYVHGYQSENTEVLASNSGKAGISGRTDIPLSKTEAQKLGREAELWKGKIRPTGRANGNTIWGSGGAYEYIATEIYGYTYEQGNHYVYITDVKKRFSLSDAAKAAGYSITDIVLTNMVPGTVYNANSDTVEGYAASTLQNGVYDMRYKVTVTKPDGSTQAVDFRNLTAGWVGWQDSSAPLIQGSSKLVTIGDQVSHDIKYVDNDGTTRDNRANYTRNGERIIAGSATAAANDRQASFTAVDGTVLTTEYNRETRNAPQTVTAHTALNGNYTGSKTPINDVVPGLNYDPKTGLITGTASEAGIFTTAVYAKDYNNTTNATNMDWNMYGQEAHENITIAVAPKITVKNVEAYATNVPVTISKGANKAEITMPDGTVTKLVVKDGNWTVAAGTTNTAVQEGAVLAAASATGDSTVNLTVTPESTKYVGVDNIVAKATTDKVKANIQREFAMVTDAANNTHKAVFNSATGKYTLPLEKAYELKDNNNGTSTLIERRVYTDAQANGDVKFIVYEFERTWSATSSATTLVDKIAEIRKKGEVTAVGAVTRTETLVKKDHTSSEQGMVVTVSYDSLTNQWTSSDGSAVTAKKSNAGWEIETESGFKGYVAYREAISTDVASIQNAKPTGTSTSYSEAKDTSVDLVKSTKANVAFADTIDDKTSATDSDTIKTKVTVTAPDGTVTNFDGAQAEETAYITAQRTAAEKTKAAATAIKEQQDTQNELARLQELLDRASRIEGDAQKALDNLKLRSISTTAQELAERKLAQVKEFKTSVEAQLATAKANLATKDTEVESTRAAALEAEKAVETARTALKTAAEANLAKANAYVLSQKGRYKVTASAVDSNGVVTTPTVDGTDAGEVTEDAVAETTYYIVVTEPEKSSGAQGQKQTDSMADNFNDGKEGTTVSNYKLVDPKTGAKVASLTTAEGTYTVDSNTGEVTFTPVEGFVGTANPVTVAADVTFNDESGNPVTVAVENAYTPTVYGIAPSADETTGKQGQPQTSKSGKDRFSELNNTDNTLDGTNVDWTTAAYSLEGANAEGKVIVDGEGTYSIDPATGVVTFEPLPTFTGKAKGVNVQVSVTATDSEGNKVPVTSKGKYTPEVTAVTPTGTPVTSEGKQGQEQTGKPTFTQGDETAPITITPKQPAKFVVNGQPVDSTEIPATKDGKEIGKYTIDPTTGLVTFKPNKDFTGTPDPATVEVKDKNGTPATATYTPTVTPVVPTAEPKETTGKQGQPQTQETESMFKKGDEVAPIDKSTVKLVDPSGNEVTTLPATKDGKEVGTYTIDPTTGVITFQPNKDFTGTPDPAKVVAKDTNGTKVETTYTPTVTPVVPTAEPKETTGKQGQPQTQETESMFKKGDEVAPIDKSTVKLVDPSGNEVTTLPATKDGKEVGTYTIDPTTGVITFQPNKDFVGTPDPAKVVAKDTNGTKVETTYTPTVTPVTPTGKPVTSEGKQGQEQTGKPTFTQGDETAPITITPEQPAKFVVNGQPVDSTEIPATKDGKEIGKYTIDPTTGLVTFKPNKDFTGTPDPATVEVKDKNGTPATATYTPTVTPVTPTAEPKETTGKQGQPQTQETESMFKKGDEVAPIDKSTVKLVDPSGNEVTTMPVLKDGKEVGTYTIDPTTGVITFQPNKDFTGTPDPAKVVAKDTNGTKVETTYTPTVTPVTPTAEPKETTGKQGQPQTQETESMFKKGDEVAPIDKSTVKLVDPSGNEVTTMPALKDGKEVGTYTIDPTTGVITFQPNKDFTGTPDPAKVVAKDTNGTKVETTYTPTVTPVTPTAEPAKTTDIQGKTQEGTPTFTQGDETAPITITPEQPAQFVVDGKPVTDTTIPATKDGKQIGTYTIDPTTGKVTFTPNKDFVGTPDPATVQVKDKNGTPTSATYTPTVTPVTPTAEPAETTDIQGKEQTGKPEFKPGNPEVPMDDEVPATFEDGSKEKVIPGEGTYTVAPDGTVTFTPEKTFTGKGTGVTVKRVDKNGTPVTAKYTPTVTPVTPEGTPAETTDIQGKEQTGKPTFKPGNPEVPMDDEVPATFEDGSTTKTIPGEGTYKVNPDGTVTFTPEKTFTGKGTGVTVKRVDKNGTPVTAKYTPTVTPVTPEGTPAESTGIQGAKQEGTPTFKPGNPNVPIDETVAPTFEDGTTEKKVPGEGTYTIDKDGKVTFTPEPQFTGTAKGVTVKRVDKNGTPVTAKYTPTVTPVTPEGTPAKSEGPKGQPQTGTPEFKPGNPNVPIDETVPPTFEDGTTTKVVPGEGTYTIDKDGKVTFTPEPQFTGTAKGVTVKRVDKNGTPVTATYTPTVRPDTKFVVVGKDGKETELIPSKDGKTPSEVIPGYKVVKTEVDAKGNTKHIYEKVTTTYKDKDGNVIPGTTTEEGTNPKKDIPGYRFVETKKLPNGDTEHVYEKVKTSFKDKEGNEIPNYPTEDGDQPKKDIPGYRFVETKKLPNGDVEHVYEKVKTSFKDKEGNEIPNYPTEDGDQPKKDIPGYRFVETKKLPNGDVEHVYEKVKTSFKDKEGNEIPNYPTEDGDQPKKDIPGYRFVETKKLPNGDVEHVYEKVKTSFKDKEGNEIPNYPTEDGDQPKKDIPGYRFVETKKLPNGDVEHVYEKVKTSFKDKEGNEIPNYPTEDGDQPKKDIPGYRFVETKKLPNGDIEHVYEKVTTPVEKSTTWVDENGNPLKPTENGNLEAGKIPGYEFVRTVVDKDGNVRHIFRKVTVAKPKPQPKRLANTGTTETNTGLAGLGMAILGGLLAGRRRKNDKN
ncbi:CshA-type fibril repeat [Gemella haemolysans]|nr:CshA-type fibril repeat [Gemella haemolysans]